MLPWNTMFWTQAADWPHCLGTAKEAATCRQAFRLLRECPSLRSLKIHYRKGRNLGEGIEELRALRGLDFVWIPPLDISWDHKFSLSAEARDVTDDVKILHFGWGMLRPKPESMQVDPMEGYNLLKPRKETWKSDEEVLMEQGCHSALAEGLGLRWRALDGL